MATELPRWLGAIVIFLEAQHQAGIAGRGAEESAAARVFEQLRICFRSGAWPVPDGGGRIGLRRDPAALGRTARSRRGIREWRHRPGGSGAAERRSGGSDMLAIRNSAARRAACGVTRLVEHGAAQREGGNHQPVPGGEDLVVQMRAHTVGARREQRRLRPRPAPRAPLPPAGRMLARFLPRWSPGKECCGRRIRRADRSPRCRLPPRRSGGRTSRPPARGPARGFPRRVQI